MSADKRKIRGMRHRWMRTSVIIVTAILLAVLVLFTGFIGNYYYSTAKSGLVSKAKTATGFFENYITNTYAEYYASASKYAETFEDGDKLELQFIDTSGRVLISTNSITSGNMPGTPDVTRAIENNKVEPYIGRSATGERIIAVSAPITYSDGQVVGVMRYITGTGRVDRQIINAAAVAFVIMVMIVLMVIFINMAFIRSFIEPVGEITQMSKRIANGSYGIQIEKTYDNEVGEMVSSINEMSIKIAQSEKMQTEFVSSVSHELRTPLTAITGWSETLLYNEDMDEESKKGIAIILREARRLTKMVEELLEFTRIEDGRFTLNIEQIDISAELEDSIFTYRELLKQDELDLVYEPCDEDIPLIPGDPARLRQVFLNIFDNAAKYARDGKQIEVSVKRDSEFVIITVRDHGDGLPEDELEHVKMKFYKGSNAKGRGSGIGLAVCDEIIRYHGGSLTLENAEGGGLAVIIRLPLSSSVN